jgi:hypothetical protein
MRRFVPPAVALRPGDDDRNAAVPLFDAIDAQVVVAFPAAPLNRRSEYLTGLVGAVSGGDGFPEPPRPPTPPLQVRMHQCDEWLDVAGAERFEGGPDDVRAHASTRSLTACGFWLRPAFRAARRASASSIGEKSGQPIWSSRLKIAFETTVASQPG